MFKIRQSKYRHVYCDAPKQAVSEGIALAALLDTIYECKTSDDSKIREDP